jgi:2-aminomuconate deaminase
MKAILESAGGSLASLVDLTVFLTSMEDYAGFNETYNRYFEGGSGPARTTVGVRELPGRDLIIEIKGLAYL